MRLLLSLLAAVGVALSLFALMIVLVMPPRVDSEPEQELARVSFVRSVSDTSSDERQRQPRELPDQPEPPEPLPEVTPAPQPVPAQPQVELNVDIPDLPTQIDLAPAPSLDSIAVAASPPAPAPAPAAPVAAPQAPAPSAPAPAPSGEPTIEQDVIPLVDIPPNYPQRAQSAGIEGKVVLRFTITAEGRVDNLRIVEAEPKGVFDREARRAAERWRFAPRQENGQAVAREASKTLYFRLQGRGR